MAQHGTLHFWGPAPRKTETPRCTATHLPPSLLFCGSPSQRHGVVGNIFRFPGFVLNALLFRRQQTPPAAPSPAQQHAQQLLVPNAASGQLLQQPILQPALRLVARQPAWAGQVQVAMPPPQAPGAQLLRHEVANAVSNATVLEPLLGITKAKLC